MGVQITCKKCQSHMAILDTFLEGYDLVCMRCGLREVVEYPLKSPGPWY